MSQTEKAYTWTQLKEEYAKLGYRLENFKGFYGKGWYLIKEADYQKGYRDYRWAGKTLESVQLNLEILKEEG